MGRKFNTRRGVLTLTGGILTGLAGCAGDSSDDDNESGSSLTPTPTATTTPTDTPIDLGQSTPEGVQTDNYIDDTTTTNVEGEGYIAYGLEHENDFTLQWTVVNELDTSADFDVFLFTAAEARIYDELVSGGNRRPQYIEGGTEQGIRESASQTVTLRGGRYVLVVDNSDYGDAGDFGTEDTRRVTITVETREA